MRSPLEPFELSIYGGAVERRYRRLRPDVDKLPWGTIRTDAYAPHVVELARRTWTEAAFQEHRTGVACAASLKALMMARAPLDLVAMASRFPLDELVHVELCARLVNELGGAISILHDPLHLMGEPSGSASALMQAAELVVENFCVGEAISIPVLRGSWHAAKHPLIRAVLGRIVKDEAAHGQFGWLFLEWADAFLTDAERAHLGQVARRGIDALISRWKSMPVLQHQPESQTLGWMEPVDYLPLAYRSLKTHVIEPLQLRGIEPGPFEHM